MHENPPLEVQAPQAVRGLRIPRLSPPPTPPKLVFLFFFGVVMPVGTLTFELVTHICGLELFDPIPTWWHVLLIALVPLVNFSVWLCALLGRCSRPQHLAHLNGFTLGVASCYALLFLPVAPFGVIGLIYLGLGLVPLTPLFAFGATLRARRVFSRFTPEKLPPMWPGFVVAVIALGLPLAWDAATLAAAQSANLAEAASTRQRAVEFLRVFGHRQALLERCYRQPRYAWTFVNGARTAQTTFEQNAQLFYRVTGIAHNTLPAPASVSVTGRRGRGMWNSDEGLGGTSVAGKVAGLTMESSRIEGKVNTAASTSYFEWTMIFKNIADNPSEARAQIELPPGGVVSRLTLWINGQEHEAAFGSRGQVRAAYQEVAVTQRRDPVLVTTAGPDRALMQCFPVPARGGEMQVRVGITAPLRLTDRSHRALLLPRIIENNFEQPAAFAHDVTLQSDEPLAAPSLAQSEKIVRQKFSERDLRARAPFTIASRHDDAVWVEDPSDPVFVIRQGVRERTVPRPTRIAVVIDGSREMRPQLDGVSAALASEQGIALFFAGDEVEQPPAGVDAAAWLRARSAAGGRDNLPALERAWDFAAAEAGGAIVWIHGSQPVLLSDAAALLQRTERSGPQPTIYDLPLRAGPNRVIEQLERYRGWRNANWSDSAANDLRRLFALWRGEVPELVLERERIPRTELLAETALVERHVARLWGLEEVERLRSPTDSGSLDRAIKLALKLQLVTPLTGAVVLENQDQYQRHGLEQIDPESAPSVPEPNVALLAALGVFALGARRFRQSGLERLIEPPASGT